MIMGMVPETLQSFVLKIVADIFTQSSAILPITGLVALWSAGKGMQALVNGLNTIYHVHETRNWFVKRIYSVFIYPAVYCCPPGEPSGFGAGQPDPGTGGGIRSLAGPGDGADLGARAFLVFFVLLMIFAILYKMLPNRKASIKSQLPGALITAVAWSFFPISFLFILNCPQALPIPTGTWPPC